MQWYVMYVVPSAQSAGHTQQRQPRESQNQDTMLDTQDVAVVEGLGSVMICIPNFQVPYKPRNMLQERVSDAYAETVPARTAWAPKV